MLLTIVRWARAGRTARASFPILHRGALFGGMVAITVAAIVYRGIGIHVPAHVVDAEQIVGEAAEQYTPMFNGTGGPSSMDARGALSALPSLADNGEDQGGTRVVGGNALTTPAISGTLLENRLRDSIESYVVQEGDTISTIAERFGISTNTILWENNLTERSLIRPGQTLSILPTSGLSHVVKSGETLANIATKYKVDARDILAFNEIEDPATIHVGQKLIVPEATPIPVLQPRSARGIVQKPSTPPPGQAVGALSGMIVPVNYRRMSQRFTWRHSGVDLATPTGTAIWASDGGVVVHAGWGNGYGLYVLIDHGNGLMTRYAHSSKIFVVVGERVAKGQTIALVGSTGNSTGPHLHFETILHGRFVDPRTIVRF